MSNLLHHISLVKELNIERIVAAVASYLFTAENIYGEGVSASVRLIQQSKEKKSGQKWEWSPCNDAVEV